MATGPYPGNTNGPNPPSLGQPSAVCPTTPVASSDPGCGSAGGGCTPGGTSGSDLRGGGPGLILPPPAAGGAATVGPVGFGVPGAGTADGSQCCGDSGGGQGCDGDGGGG